MVRKVAGNSDPGNSAEFGGDDIDYINQYLTGVDQSAIDPVSIATTTIFSSTKLQINNPTNTYQYVIVAPSIVGDRNLYLPLLTADDTLVCANSAQPIAQYDAYPSIKKDAQLNVLGNNTGNLEGQFIGFTLVGAGSITSVYDTGEAAQVLALATTATANLNAGLVSPTVGIGFGRTLTTMQATYRGKVSATSNIRLYVGFTSLATLPITDAPLGTADSGVIVGFSSTDGTFQVFYNDGTGTALKQALGITKDTNYHTIDLNSPFAGSANWNVTLDGGNPVTLNSRIPATTTNLYYNAVAQSTTTTAITHTMRYAQGTTGG